MAFKPASYAVSVAFFCCLILAAHRSVRADEPLHIMATDWGLTLKSDGSGFYNDLAKLVLPKALGHIQYEILPYKRAKRTFMAGGADCLYPNSLEYLVATGSVENAEIFIGSRSVVAAQSRIFSPFDVNPPAAPQDLQGLTVAYALGSDVANLLKGSGAYFVAVSDEVGKARMLLEGRIDLLVAVLPDAKFVFDSLGTDLPPFDPDFSLDSTEIGLVCHRTATNMDFVQRFNAHMKTVVSDGRLRTFLETKGLDPAAHMPRQE